MDGCYLISLGLTFGNLCHFLLARSLPLSFTPSPFLPNLTFPLSFVVYWCRCHTLRHSAIVAIAPVSVSLASSIQQQIKSPCDARNCLTLQKKTQLKLFPLLLSINSGIDVINWLHTLNILRNCCTVSTHTHSHCWFRVLLLSFSVHFKNLYP